MSAAAGSSRACAREGCSRPGGRSSCCSRAARLGLPARPRACAWPARRACARCTSTTACASRAGGDEAHCRALCGALGVPLEVRRPARPERGNLQAWARDQRYAEAARLARPRRALVAAGHTATDQVETVLYRLAASPGRRALLGMPARDGRLVRPLLGLTREETAAYCAERGLAWREDPTNASPAFARNRTRHELLAALRALHPAAEANVLRTLAVLRDEAAVLDARGRRAPWREAGDPPAAAALAALPPALRRLALQRLADRAATARPRTRRGRRPARPRSGDARRRDPRARRARRHRGARPRRRSARACASTARCASRPAAAERRRRPAAARLGGAGARRASPAAS